MEGFKKFLLQGNVVELAVAVVIGTAFTAIVAAFTEAIITPLLAQAFNADAIADATIGPFKIGLLIAAIINFVIIAAIVYFVLILPMAKLKERMDRRKGITPDEPVETDVEILHDIRELLRAQQAGPPRT
ncbi:large conductance mechanosensitive channel protein MscL [Agrococcus sp. Marseille-Q4369]|uniref:large conductance mechanosensitive channel protein MscL n=1 Tax=Agrococcus sp. Marseille-Q4369 TaxID=2810513 RepID=UPI001B8C8822|nr:large conductance mechanosensitive channel protein MscL [Agrococcus sp. Marseille-Q4369]QUW19828.1 large conductance mechanosensitive channel protein MscL [Agrococcus sp. Marseille-Q4369]